MLSQKKYEVYVINLDSAPERWAHMQMEFKDTILNLIRFPAVRHKEGWQGCGESYVKLVRQHMERDPDFTGPLLIVLEDDLFRLQDVDAFNERCSKIFKYLEENRGSYSHFQGGGIYPSGFSLETRDPLLLRCDYITSTTFNVIGKEAANSILEWDTNRSTTIDNYIANANRGRILAPFPALTWQIIGLPSQIGDMAYAHKYTNEFRTAHKAMADFVKKQPGLDFRAMLGGGKRRRRVAARKASRKASRSPRKTHKRRRRNV